MEEQRRTVGEFDGIQRLRDNVSKLKELILKAQQEPAAAPDDSVQPSREEGSALYIEIRPQPAMDGMPPRRHR
jgi:hypothetical protein